MTNDFRNWSAETLALIMIATVGYSIVYGVITGIVIIMDELKFWHKWNNDYKSQRESKLEFGENYTRTEFKEDVLEWEFNSF